MELRRLQRTWDDLGRSDALWAVLSSPDKRGGRWDLEEFLATGVREIDEVLRWLRALGLDVPRGRALDFGCGVGRLTQPLAAHFTEAVGVDIAPSMIEHARQINRMGERCRFVLNTRDDLGVFPDAHFDFVYSNITLQHMPPKLAERYLSEFMRMLAPAGLLVFQLPAEPPRTLVNAVKSLVPVGARTWWHQLKERLGRKPSMQMFWMAPGRVEQLTAARGGAIIAVQDDHATGGGWTGKRYVVKHRGS